MTPDDVRHEILRFVQGKAVDRRDIADETNLLESGLLDSIGFVGLISHLEEHFDVDLDLVEKPIEEFVFFGALVRQVQGG